MNPRRRFGLRTRATIATALGGLAVAGLLAAVTFFLVRSYLVSQRESTALRQVFANARIVRDALRADPADPTVVLQSVRTDRGGALLVRYRTAWFSPTVGTGPDLLPESVRRAVEQGVTGRQKVEVGGDTKLAVVVALPEVDATHVELLSLRELDSTLRTVLGSLAVGALFAASGGAALGAWTSRRALRPLAEVADAAGSLAEGDLGHRLAHEPDPDLERLVEAFNAMAAALSERIERDERFASDVSHELRTPLATMLLTADVLERRRDELEPRGREALDLLLAEVRALDRLVNDLLEISRLDAGVDALDPSPADLCTVVQEALVAQGLTSVPVQAGEAWRYREVLVDVRRLERVLANLLENAVKHAGGPVAVRLSGSGGTARIEIDDAGPGMSAVERETVFDRFRRGTSAQNTPGSGLGLALVAEHVRLLGGEVVLEARPGGGVRAVVEIPVEDA